jgi:hypothetical protein
LVGSSSFQEPLVPILALKISLVGSLGEAWFFKFLTLAAQTTCQQFKKVQLAYLKNQTLFSRFLFKGLVLILILAKG